MAEKKKMQIGEAERERRRQLARKLNREGKFGGSQRGSGRPKKDRAGTLVAEGIREDGEKILSTLRKSLKGPPSVALKAALAMLELERQEVELQIKEEQRAFDNLSHAALVEHIVNRLDTLEKAGIDIETIIGRAREIEPERLASGGTETDSNGARRALPPGERSGETPE